MFSWVNFGEIENDLYDLSNVVASNSGCDRFQSLLTYAYSGGRVLLPYLLGFNLPGIAQILVSAVYQKYPHLFPSFHPSPKFKK